MRVISESVLRSRIPLDKAVANQRDAFRVYEVSKTSNEVVIPERLIGPTSSGVVLFKPFLSDEAFGLKVVSVRETGTPATILLFDTVSGTPTALMNATYLTALRTAAGSAVALELATDSKASHTLTVFGAGLQAELHIRCFAAIRRLGAVHLVNRNVSRAETLASRLRNDEALKGVSIVVAASSDDVPAALQKSSLVVTATGATNSLFDGRLLQPKTFVAAVGSFQPHMRELDETVLKRAFSIADTPDGVRKTTGEFADEDIAIGASLGELVCGEKKIPEDTDLVVFKSIGCAIQDMFIARLALECCSDSGQKVEL